MQISLTHTQKWDVNILLTSCFYFIHNIMISYLSGGDYMFDATLARKILNKIGKELVNAMTTAEGETRNEIQRALNDITFMYDILHLDEIEVIDISKQPTN